MGRPIRQVDISTLGSSTQTRAEETLQAGRWELAAELVECFVIEIRIMNDVLFTWLADGATCWPASGPSSRVAATDGGLRPP